MIAANTKASRLNPLILGIRLVLGLVVVLAIVVTLALTALFTSQNNPVFAESQPASQHDVLNVGMDGQYVIPGSSGEDAGTAIRESDTEMNEIAVWFTRMAIGLSSDSAVSYLTYIHNVPPPDQEATTASASPSQ